MMRANVRRLIGTSAAILAVTLSGTEAVEAQAVTSIAIVVAPMDRIACTGAPAVTVSTSALRTLGPSQGGVSVAQDLCATTRNEDPAWLLRASTLSISRTASAPESGKVSKDPTVVTCTLVSH